ncbi:hypothetical protein OLV20_09460, partial [Campylobacter jejuni]|nr:hypothetical protein [Campylobacter jejuni]
ERYWEVTKQEIQKTRYKFPRSSQAFILSINGRTLGKICFYGIFQELVFSSTLPGGWITDNYSGQKRLYF